MPIYVVTTRTVLDLPEDQFREMERQLLRTSEDAREDPGLISDEIIIDGRVVYNYERAEDSEEDDDTGDPL